MSRDELLALLRPLESESYFGQLNTLLELMVHHCIQASQASKAGNLDAERLSEREMGRYHAELHRELDKYRAARDAIRRHRPKLLRYMPIEEGQDWNCAAMSEKIRAIVGELLAETVPIQPQAQAKTKSKKPGPKAKRYDPAVDEKLIRDWRVSGLTRDEFDNARGLEPGETFAACERHRKRKN